MRQRALRPRPVSTKLPTAMTNEPATVVWRFVDGKRGHENQSLGLVEALARLRNLDIHTLSVTKSSRLSSTFAWLLGRFSDGRFLPKPNLVIGAGHATHIPMLAAKRARGGKTIVLMNPSLPLSCFDLCVIPEHDEPRERANVVITHGVLNRIQRATTLNAKNGLILLGGPSEHYRWSDERLLEQLSIIVTDSIVEHWTVATSRRTPVEVLPMLRHLNNDRLSLVAVDSVDSDWLTTELVRCANIWVTQDSVSMVYEALTAGAATGILEVPARGTSRVHRGIEKLVGDGWVTSFSQWRAGDSLRQAPGTFHEAHRTASLIAQKWL